MFNLRGNCRTSGEQRRKESGNVFGEGSRTPISITILVRKPKKDPNELANILYKDIGDYLTREDKLKTIRDHSSMLSASIGLSSIVPNEAGDWINQRDGLFETFIQIGSKEDKTAKTFFVPYYSCGVKTQRDTWCYNYSKSALTDNMERTIQFYNSNLGQKPVLDSTKINWTYSTTAAHDRGDKKAFDAASITPAMYRPFCKQFLYFNSEWNERVYQMPKIFPTPQSKNLVICTAGVGAKTFSTLITDQIPDLHVLESGTQCFPLYMFEKNDRDALSLFDNNSVEYTRRSAITDFILGRAREAHGPKISSEDVFYYVYGILHSYEYRKRFSADLIKALPRIPFDLSTQDFKSFVKAGRKLAELHLNYETGPLCQQLIITGDDDPNKLKVTKMRFPSKENKGAILFNEYVKIENIPMVAYDYVVNGKSAVEWIMERYAVTKNSDSGIVNNPNLWCDNPRYILDLVSRVIQMSVETQKIVVGLPKLEFSQQRS